jgi:hypothetical protein
MTLRNPAQYTCDELRHFLGPETRTTFPSPGVIFIARPTPNAGHVAERGAANLSWDCGCLASMSGAGIEYCELRSCQTHRSLPPSPSMAAHLLADVTRMDDLERAQLLSRQDRIDQLFDAATLNINPLILPAVFRRSDLPHGSATLVEVLLNQGADAAINALRTDFEEIDPHDRVGILWHDVS